MVQNGPNAFFELPALLHSNIGARLKRIEITSAPRFVCQVLDSALLAANPSRVESTSLLSLAAVSVAAVQLNNLRFSDLDVSALRSSELTSPVASRKQK